MKWLSWLDRLGFWSPSNSSIKRWRARRTVHRGDWHCVLLGQPPNTGQSSQTTFLLQERAVIRRRTGPRECHGRCCSTGRRPGWRCMGRPLLWHPRFLQEVPRSLCDSRGLFLQILRWDCHSQVLRVTSFFPDLLHQAQFVRPFASCFSTHIIMGHPLSKGPGRSRQFPPCLQLRQVLFLLVLDVGKCGLQLLSILI